MVLCLAMLGGRNRGYGASTTGVTTQDKRYRENRAPRVAIKLRSSSVTEHPRKPVQPRSGRVIRSYSWRCDDTGTAVLPRETVFWRHSDHDPRARGGYSAGASDGKCNITCGGECLKFGSGERIYGTCTRRMQQYQDTVARKRR